MRNRTRLRPTVELLEERLPLAGETFLVNFELAGDATPNGYLADAGDLFGDRLDGHRYGWSSDHTDVSREYGLEPDRRLDTLIRFHAAQHWEFELPDGNYQVTVSIGDPSSASTHTINVEGSSYWNAVSLAAGDFLAMSSVVNVSDGRLTIDQGAAAEQATRINYVHIQGLANAANTSPGPPIITEPAADSSSLSPIDVHMEAVGFFDADGDSHLSTDWEIWTTGPGAERVWFTLGIQGVERLHTHLGDGYFENSHAGRIDMLPDTNYELRVRFRDDAGAVSNDALRSFATGAASTIFALSLDDVLDAPPVTWELSGGLPIELPSTGTLLSPQDAIVAVDLDGNSDYPGDESPANAVDGTLAKYLNFGKVNAGFIVTPASGASILQSFQMTTANDAEERDPTSWQLFGTNDAIVSGDNSSGNAENWTLIESGAVSLPAARNTAGPIVELVNDTAFTSYRMIVTGIKNDTAANSMQFAEIQFFGTLQSGPLLSPTNPIIAIDLDGGSSYPGDETPRNAIDRTTNKYLNFGEINSGFIVTPSDATSVVSSFQITTANDAEERDPTSWQLFGTNAAIASTDNSRGNAESWTLIDSGSVNLPGVRNADGPVVLVDNDAAYTSYRMVFTGVKNAASANSLQFSEIQFFGSQSGMPSPPSLTLESASGELLLFIEGSDLAGNAVTNPPALAEHVAPRVVISGGSSGLRLAASDLRFYESQGQPRRICLPALDLAPGESVYLWVAVDGSTYYGLESQTQPVFNQLARDCETNVPFLATQPNYVVDVVAEGFQLPVNVAFVPNPGPAPSDPAFYVTELYGTIKVVTNNGTVADYATNLLNFNPTGNFPGSGEQGLSGIVVDPATGDVFVTRVTDTDGLPGGEHHPQVVRFTSSDGGRTAASETVILDMVGESQGQSHQISNISIGPDNKLYVHNGDGFDASTALNLNSYRGKVLRVNFDGSAPDDNPFYDVNNGINARDYIFAYGFRNPFGGAWRAADGGHYQVENGPSVDRFSKVEEGVNYGWDGSNASMFTNALYNWNPAHAPVNISFVQPETFNGSQFPAEKFDHAFVSESGPTYANGPQASANGSSSLSWTQTGTSATVPRPWSNMWARGEPPWWA